MYRVGGMGESSSPRKDGEGRNNNNNNTAESSARAAVEKFVQVITAEQDRKGMVDGRLLHLHLHRIVMTTLDARVTAVAYLTERAPVLVADNKRGKLIWEDAHEEDEMDMRLSFLHVRGSPDESPLEVEYRRPVQSKNRNRNRKSTFVSIFGYFYQVRTEKNKVSNIVLVEYIEK